MPNRMMITGTKYIYAFCLKSKEKIEEFEKHVMDLYLNTLQNSQLSDINFAEMGKPFLMGYWDSLVPNLFNHKYTRLLDNSLAFYGEVHSFSSMSLGFRYSNVKKCKVHWNEMDIPLKKNSSDNNKPGDAQEYPDKRCCIHFKVDWSLALSSKVLLCSIEEKIHACMLKIKSVAHSIQEACEEILQEANKLAAVNSDKKKLMDVITKDLNSSINARNALEEIYKNNTGLGKNDTKNPSSR